jgi:hypothetical protein
MPENSPHVREIDITHGARPWRWVRLADYIMVIFCTYVLIGMLVTEVTKSSLNFGSLVFVPTMIAVLALNLYAGWSIMGKISLRHHWIAIVSLLLLVPIGLFAASVGAKNLQSATGEAAIRSAISVIMLGGIIGLGALVGVAGFLRVRWSKIRDLHMSLKEFLAETEKLRVANPPPARLPAQSKGRGAASGLGGLGLMLAQGFAPDAWAGFIFYATPLGWYLLLRCRGYFQPDFQHLIAADTRPPIIFLRSFADDQAVHYTLSETAFVDFSLESRLANYFHDFGPFIAVGSARNQQIGLGAARVQLSDSEWQAKVLGWMGTSSVIVLFPGLTPSVNWELKETVTTKHANKLLVIFPAKQRRAGWGWWRRRLEAEQRLNAMKEDLKDTPWSAALNQVDRPKTLRAMTFAPSGDITVIRSRTRIRDSYHLAAMIAHFLHLKENLPPASQT